MQWVQENIRFFGGDPNQVTIFAESAGAISESFLMVTPQADGLYQRVIIESYTGNSGVEAPALGPLYWNLEKQQNISDFVIEQVRCDLPDPADVVACLRALDVETLHRFSDITIFERETPELALDHHQWNPVPDGFLVPDDPRVLFETGQFSRVDVIAGTNSDEGTLFVPDLLTMDEDEELEMLQIFFPEIAQEVFDFYEQNLDDSPGYRFAEGALTHQVFACPIHYMLDQMRNFAPELKLFGYQFDHQGAWIRCPGEFCNNVPLRVFHGSELPYVWGPHGNLPNPLPEEADDDDILVHLNFMQFWTNFAKTGSPGFDISGELEWPEYGIEQNFMVIDSPLRTEVAYLRPFCDFWDANTPVATK